MNVALASDHAGFAYKERIKDWLAQRGHTVVDFGTTSTESCDYPQFVVPAARAVASGECDRGIVLGGSGNGEAMAANKVRGARCALCYSVETAKLARNHNDANMMSIGERLTPFEVVEQMLEMFLNEEFEGGRHVPRVRMLDEIEP